MWRLTCVLLLLLQSHLGGAQFDLAQNIFQQVHDSLRGTANLGRISVPNNYQPLATDLGQQIFKSVHDSLSGTANLGSHIAESVHQQLAPLQNLGLNIHNQVSKSLMPVNAMAIKNNMKNGVGGTTVATYYGNRPRSFIIKDGFRSVCNGNVDGPKCYGYLEPFDIATKEDFCYAKSYASVNSRICLSSGHINVYSHNDKISCEASDGSPTLILTQREYRQLCGNTMPWQVLYTYYANPNDPRAIPIPNPNPYVVCQNGEPGVCEFEADAGGSGTVISSSSGFHSNSYNTFQ